MSGRVWHQSIERYFEQVKAIVNVEAGKKARNTGSLHAQTETGNDRQLEITIY